MIVPIETIARASEARRPLTQPTSAVGAGDGDQQLTRGLGHVRVGGVVDDRRQGAVDVQQDRRALRVGSERRERLG